MEAIDLNVMYRDHGHSLLALDRVSLSLEPGRITALVGESGSGKTTLGKALMGLLPPNAEVRGEIRLDGRDLAGATEAEFNALRSERMAMVFQNGAANLNPVHRLVDQVAEPLIQRSGIDPGRGRERALTAIREMGLKADLALRYPHELSGGQVQRALLAMALILDPEYLILDEPTASLDAMTAHFIAGLLRRLREQGKAILLITHDLNLARTLADDLAVLYMGRVMETMPAGDLLAAPAHPYTLALGRSYPDMETVRDLGGIRGDAFYRLVHAHGPAGESARHSHVAAPRFGS